jgi:hypothetical protein
MENYDVANYVWNFSCKRDEGSIQLQQPQLIKGSQLDGVKSIRWNSEKKCGEAYLARRFSIIWKTAAWSSSTRRREERLGEEGSS